LLVLIGRAELINELLLNNETEDVYGY
jgi:hypothetical protein